jgi:hypothetical protein
VNLGKFYVESIIRLVFGGMGITRPGKWKVPVTGDTVNRVYCSKKSRAGRAMSGSSNLYALLLIVCFFNFHY